jgi:hypothetical protein
MLAVRSSAGISASLGPPVASDVLVASQELEGVL